MSWKIWKFHSVVKLLKCTAQWTEKCRRKKKSNFWSESSILTVLRLKNFISNSDLFLMKDGRTKGRPQENAESAIFFGENISRDVFTTFCKLPWSMECCTEDCTSFILTMYAPQLVREWTTDVQQIFCTELILTEQNNTKPISSLARIIKFLCESS